MRMWLLSHYREHGRQGLFPRHPHASKAYRRYATPLALNKSINYKGH